MSKTFSHRNAFWNWAPGLSILLVLLVSANAATLQDYQKRVKRAQGGVAILLDNIAREEAGERVDEPNASVIDGIRGLLPPTEEIVTNDGTITTANQWYSTDLERALAETDRTKRAVILTGIDQRLIAISERIDPLIDAVSDVRSKDDDKQKLGEILSRPEYQRPEQQTESVAGKVLRRFVEWIESLFPRWSPSSSSLPGIGGYGSLLQYLLIAAVLGAIVFLLYRFRGILFPGRRIKRTKESKDRVVLGEVIGENVTAQDLFGEADALARTGDMRGAIRKGYIALLFEMSERSLVSLARHKTNRDYLRDLKSKKETFQAVRDLTGSFERHWYGSRPAGEDDWARFRNGCGNAIETIN